MGLSEGDKARLRVRHYRDQIDAITPQSLRELQATADEDGTPLFTRTQRREYLRRAERLERGATS